MLNYGTANRVGSWLMIERGNLGSYGLVLNVSLKLVVNIRWFDLISSMCHK